MPMLHTKTTITKLIIFEPKLTGLEENKITLKEAEAPDCYIYYQEPSDGYFNVDQFHHFPALLNSDGSPWTHGTLYLLSKLECSRTPSSKTLESIASDLSQFREYVLSNSSINYLISPKRKLQRPTYAYRAYLQELLQDGLISKNTASRRMSSVIGFYRWLEKQHDTYFEHPLWDDKEIYIQFHTIEGLSKIKQIKSTNLAVRVPVNKESFNDYIVDGGKLRPLSKVEQENLIKALISTGTPEMTLAFLIALTTGARIQTVFTLRLKHIEQLDTTGRGEIPILVGIGTDADTKFQKKMTIFLPTWLLEKLKTYSQSERAKRRRSRSAHNFPCDNDQYLFLTQSGAPYYIAFNDPAITAYRHPPRGNAVRQFIDAQLIPTLIKQGVYFAFSFHDLRATYGMNLLEEKLRQIEAGQNKLFDVLMLIRERLGHNKIQTTENYLNYRRKQSIALNTQSNFEKYLQSLIETNAHD